MAIGIPMHAMMAVVAFIFMSTASEGLLVYVRDSDGERRYPVDLDPMATVGALKDEITQITHYEQRTFDIEFDQQILSNTQEPLADVGLSNEVTVQIKPRHDEHVELVFYEQSQARNNHKWLIDGEQAESIVLHTMGQDVVSQLQDLMGLRPDEGPLIGVTDPSRGIRIYLRNSEGKTSAVHQVFIKHKRDLQQESAPHVRYEDGVSSTFGEGLRTDFIYTPESDEQRLVLKVYLGPAGRCEYQFPPDYYLYFKYIGADDRESGNPEVAHRRQTRRRLLVQD